MLTPGLSCEHSLPCHTESAPHVHTGTPSTAAQVPLALQSGVPGQSGAPQSTPVHWLTQLQAPAMQVPWPEQYEKPGCPHGSLVAVTRTVRSAVCRLSSEMNSEPMAPKPWSVRPAQAPVPSREPHMRIWAVGADPAAVTSTDAQWLDADEGGRFSKDAYMLRLPVVISGMAPPLPAPVMVAVMVMSNSAVSTGSSRYSYVPEGTTTITGSSGAPSIVTFIDGSGASPASHVGPRCATFVSTSTEHRQTPTVVSHDPPASTVEQLLVQDRWSQLLPK
mmetsp:Transcript_20613/g.66104  ORF Transcript_20613/g.66104 Transcript_20613/m.66104 type:complete len:277 (-) Transcript_20613:1991-2821(-)